MNNKLFTQEVGKSVDFSPWGGLEGFLEASKAGNTGSPSIMLKRAVPDLARAVDMTATAVASLPFEFVDAKTNKVIDSSVDWKDKLGGFPNPQRLLYLLASSLCGGAAYMIPRRTPKLIYDLTYCAPHNVTPQIGREGLKWFDRSTDEGKFETIYPDKMIYFWLPDSDVEIGPAKNTPLSNAMMDAMLLLNATNTMAMYGKRGFVPITLLGAKGMPNQTEREKSERFFDRLLKGGFDVLAKIVNSEALSLIKVGAGMDELRGSYVELKKESKEAIAQAFGIPAAIFLSDNAFASEVNPMRRHWYETSRFVSICHTIEEVISEQLLKKYGAAMFFRPETLDIFQEDESARAASLGSLVSAIDTSPQTAKFGMSILGYELNEKQKGELDKLIATKEEDKRKAEEAAAQQLTPNPNDPKDEQAEKVPAKSVVNLSPESIKDLALWRQMALRFLKKGKALPIDFEAKALPEDVAAPIRLKLAEAKTEAQVNKAFDFSEVSSDMLFTPEVEALKELAKAINDAVNK
jgi:hypothetical protein